jgi:hypothetical protein
MNSSATTLHLAEKSTPIDLYQLSRKYNFFELAVRCRCFVADLLLEYFTEEDYDRVINDSGTHDDLPTS